MSLPAILLWRFVWEAAPEITDVLLHVEYIEPDVVVVVVAVVVTVWATTC